MTEEAAPTQGQDPAQGTAASAPAAPQQQPAAPPQTPSAPAAPGPGPWANDLQSTFEPEIAARVDAFLRERVQPRITQLEQTNAQARELYDAFQADPYAAEISISRQLYGDQYADQLAQNIGRPDLVVAPAPAPAAPPNPAAAGYTQPYEQGYQGNPGPPTAPAQQPAAGDPRYEEMYAEWSERRQQEAYDAAKAEFLSDPQYADIKPELFDPFAAGAETWEDAANNYRAYAAQFAQAGGEQSQPDPPPPTMGSETQGGTGQTPAVPQMGLNETIDDIFASNKPAPPTFG